jgi:hypothetical protein
MSICEQCAAGADVSGALPPDLRSAPDMREIVRVFHEGCPGGTWCDCQHKGTGWRGPLAREQDAPMNVGVVREPTNPDWGAA